MNKYQQQVLEDLNLNIFNNSNKQNKNYFERTQHLIKTITELDIISKYDLTEDNLSVERISDSSLGVYFNLRKNTKLIIIAKETEYIIFYKQTMRDDWQKVYVENLPELKYSIEQFL